MSCDYCDYDDYEKQVLYETKHCYVIYPRSPVYEHHFMIITKKHHTDFTKLSVDELADVKSIVQHIRNSFFRNKKENLLGYNLFSNNEDESAGESVSHFHCHLFMRLEGEEKSPYAIMANKDLKEDVSKKEWNKRVDTFVDMF